MSRSLNIAFCIRDIDVLTNGERRRSRGYLTFCTRSRWSRFGNLLYLALVIAAVAAAAAAREGSESVRRATKLRRGSPEGASEREIEEGLRVA